MLRPGPVKLLERVASARARAERDTYDWLAGELTPARCAGLDAMLAVDPEIGMTRLRWLGTGPTDASAAVVKTEVRKLLFLRGVGAHRLDLSRLPAERRRFLGAVGGAAVFGGEAWPPRSAPPVPDHVDRWCCRKRPTAASIPVMPFARTPRPCPARTTRCPRSPSKLGLTGKEYALRAQGSAMQHNTFCSRLARFTSMVGSASSVPSQTRSC